MIAEGTRKKLVRDAYGCLSGYESLQGVPARKDEGLGIRLTPACASG